MSPTATPAAAPAASRSRHATSFGEHLRAWRQRRRWSQMALALEADVSARHLSFVETGRAEPSREMVLRLAERLQVPLRERNTLLVAAGYAPMYRDRTLDDPAMSQARAAVELVLRAHEPCPALALDRHYQLVAANRAVPLFLQGLPAELLAPPVNIVRLSLHPQGLAPRIVNFGQWVHHLVERLRQQLAATADPVLEGLLAEALAVPVGDAEARLAGEWSGVVLPLQLRTPAGVWTFFSTLTVFGSPNDITLQELALEAFFPADAATAEGLRAALAQAAPAEAAGSAGAG